MPASLLYHTNQITDIQVKNVEYFESKIVYHAIFKPRNSICKTCGHTECRLDGMKKRNLRIAPLGNKSAFLSLETHRQRCTNCGQVWWPIIPFVRGKKTSY